MIRTLKCTPLPTAVRRSALFVSLTAAMSLAMLAHAHAAAPAPTETKAGTPISSTTSYRSDQLIGTGVFSPSDQKVDDYWKGLDAKVSK